MTAKDVYDILLQKEIKKSKGFINFDFLGITTTIAEKSSVGYVFQEWLEVWMKNNKIKFEKNTNSQDWPDFFLEGDENNKEGVVEIKTFDADKKPAFDIANFDAYCHSLKTNAYRLDADYLIFSYTLDKKGVFQIKDVWLKKVWEISVPSEKYPVNCQVKKDVIYNLRPGIWYSPRAKFKPFDSRSSFVEAINKTHLKYHNISETNREWLDAVRENYKKHTGKDL